MATALVICPTYDHADTLFASIASVRAQTFTDWEMAVICDGSPPRTQEVLAAIAEVEPRIRIYRHPKSERFGEVYRDPVIRDSSAELVFHLSDDDIWLSDHLAQMAALLEHAEWVNQAPLRISESGFIEWWPVNHGTPAMRASIRRRRPPSAGINYVAYRRDAYLRLPEGWTCAPREAGTSDVYMWAKFFDNPELSVASSAVTSAVKFPSTLGSRRGFTPERRLAEITPWLARAAEPGLGAALSRKGSIFGRMIMLFAIHGAGENTEQGFKRAGLSPAPAETSPSPAVDGAPMALPLTAAQKEEARRAWVFVRAYTDVDDARRIEARETFAHESAAFWLGAARQLSVVAGVDAGLAALADCCDMHPNDPAPLAHAAEQLLRAGRENDADRYLKALARRWPEHPLLKQQQRRSGGVKA